MSSIRVVILMSTFQGERYVGEQLRSILDQLPVGGRILVRDDGSTDKTVQVIEALRDERITLHRGENIGFVRSFFALIHAAPVDADMIMLADQDDLWLPGKIERAKSKLAGQEAIPALYCSRLRLVDTNLRLLGLSPKWPRPPTFENALTENIVTGCTAAFNHAALDLVRNHGNIDCIYFHDWWLYLVISAFGRVYSDPEPSILYRQHGGNAIGMGAGLRRYWLILRFLRKRNWVHIMFRQSENFRAIHFHALPENRKQFLDRFFNPHDPRAIARLIFSPKRLRQTLLSDVLFRMILIFEIVTGRGVLPRQSRKEGFGRRST